MDLASTPVLGTAVGSSQVSPSSQKKVEEDEGEGSFPFTAHPSPCFPGSRTGAFVRDPGTAGSVAEPAMGQGAGGSEQGHCHFAVVKQWSELVIYFPNKSAGPAPKGWKVAV